MMYKTIIKIFCNTIIVKITCITSGLFEALYSAYKQGHTFKIFRLKNPQWRYIRIMDYSNMTSFGTHCSKVFWFIPFYLWTIYKELPKINSVTSLLHGRTDEQLNCFATKNNKTYAAKINMKVWKIKVIFHLHFLSK